MIGTLKMRETKKNLLKVCELRLDHFGVWLVAFDIQNGELGIASRITSERLNDDFGHRRPS